MPDSMAVRVWSLRGKGVRGGGKTGRRMVTGFGATAAAAVARRPAAAVEGSWVVCLVGGGVAPPVA